MREVQLSWKGTPYMSGQQVKGPDGAVDCIRFGTGCLDDLYGYQRKLPTNLSLDACVHAPKESWAALRLLRRVYPETEILSSEDGTYLVEPMDMVIMGPVGGGPGHLVVVGWEPNTCWEASAPCVRKIGIGLDATHRSDVKRVYRMRDRHRWIRN